MVIHCWRRVDADLEIDTQALELEQLLWYDALAAIASTPPCAESPVPAARVRLADEGVCDARELLEDAPPRSSEAGDAVRLGSLAFLRQYVSKTVLEHEVVPRLMPEPGGVARVFSADLSGSVSSAPAPRRAKSLDDLFPDSDDEGAGAAWSRGAIHSDGKDPLVDHELTSVLLVGEKTGFAACFHCLAGM